MKLKHIIPAWLMMMGGAAAQAPLEGYLRMAAENNPGLRATFSEYYAALEMIPQAGALPDPQVMFRYFATPLLFEMGIQRFTLSASQMFPWFGQLKAEKEAAAEMAKAKYESFIHERNQLFYMVKENYFEWYVWNKSVQLTAENLALLRSMRELARINFEAGKGSFVNVLRADMEIAEKENELARLKEGEQPLRAEFESLLNSKVSVLFPDTLWKDSLPDAKTVLLDSIAANNPALKNLEHEIAAWEKELAAAKKMGYPSFSLGAGYMSMSKRAGDIPGNGRDMFMFPEIGVTLPLNRKKYRAMANEAKYRAEAVTFERENMKNEFLAELEAAYRDYLNAERSVLLYTRLYALAGNVRELLLSAYSAAGTDFEEVLRMQESELVYALALEEARAALNSAVAHIDFITGKGQKP